MTLLDVQGLRAGYGRGIVVDDVSFAVGEGSAITLLGANGAGKTTALRAVTGLLRSRGSIRLAGHDLTRRSADAIARMGVAHVPEGRRIFAPLSVEENLRLGGHRRQRHANVRADLDRCYELFPRLRERARQRAGTLSGGEQQMLALGRALMSRPRIVLLDEPSLGLAPKVTRELFAVLDRLRLDDGVALVVVEQNAELALAIADHAYVFESGRVALDGPADEIRSDAAMRRAYLGY